MKKLVTLAAAGIAALAASAAVAQPYHGGPGVRHGHGPGPIVRPVGPPVRYVPPRRPVLVFTPLPRIPIWTSAYPYAATFHDTCQRKAWRLRWFERRAAADGYFTASERYELAALRRDLGRTCGGWRWRD